MNYDLIRSMLIALNIILLNILYVLELRENKKKIVDIARSITGVSLIASTFAGICVFFTTNISDALSLIMSATIMHFWSRFARDKIH